MTTPHPTIAETPLFAWGAQQERAQAQQAQHAKEVGIARVQQSTPDGWKGYADSQVRELLERTPEITADDVREVVQLTPPNGRNAWGGYMVSLVKRGWLRPTGRMAQSRQPQGHGNRLLVYASSLYRGGR